jgi:gas vesicle protein
MGKNSGFGKFLLGAGIGVGVGMLFAPKKGSELRKDLKKKIDELIDAVQAIDYDDVREKIVNKAKEIEKELKELDGEKVLKIVKTKAKQIETKANELVDMAVETAKPALQDMANDIKAKTIKTLKAITKKLEGAK